MINKIITHSGKFHADEVMAIAILTLNKNILIQRKDSVMIEELNDSKIFVLDIGGQYNKELSNYDHHQDQNLEATCILIGKEHLASDFYEWIKPLLIEISDIDRGIRKSNKFDFNRIITSYNWLTDNPNINFFDALHVAKMFLQGQIKIFESYKEGLEKFKKLEKFGVIAISHEKEIANWREYAIENNIVFLVCPNREEGKYSIITVDSTKWPIPPHPDQTFRHNSGFMAVYPSFEIALKDAQDLNVAYYIKSHLKNMP